MKKLPAFGKIAALAIFVSACLPADGFSLFGSERSRLLKEADQTYENAQKAGSDGRVLDEISTLSDARVLYGRLLEEHPNYRTEHVDARFKRCGAHLRIIAARIKSGEISIPSPDAIMQGEGEGYVTAQVPAPNPSVPGYRSEIPPLVDTATLTLKPEDIVPLTEETPQTTEPTQQALNFSKKMPSPALKTPKTAEEETGRPQTQATLEKADASMRIRMIHELITSRKAPEAVLLLEDLIEKESDATSETTRLLLVRALLECRNYRRAQQELAPLMQANSPSPAARTFASALALQKDNLPEAMYQMDRLLHDYPAYSDAYVNMAYLYFMMNPKTNRDMSIVCYRSALAYGAKRDPAFEMVLGIEIVK